MKESVLQTKCNKYAKEQLPNVSISRSSTEGFPDRAYFWARKAFFVEFKATGKKPSELQIEKHRELYKSGMYTFVIDNFEDFKEAVNVFKNDKFLWTDDDFYIRCCYYDKKTQTFDL